MPKSTHRQTFCKTHPFWAKGPNNVWFHWNLRILYFDDHSTFSYLCNRGEIKIKLQIEIELERGMILDNIKNNYKVTYTQRYLNEKKKLTWKRKQNYKNKSEKIFNQDFRVDTRPYYWIQGWWHRTISWMFVSSVLFSSRLRSTLKPLNTLNVVTSI